MANFKRIRLVFGKASPLLKTVVAAVIVLSTITLITLRMGQLEAKAATDRLQQQASQLERDNARLTQRIDALGTAESIRLIAEEELGLVEPDTIIFDIE